ncbi:MAG: VWA domain-containing protein [Acutalibacteraceae bacterium]
MENNNLNLNPTQEPEENVNNQIAASDVQSNPEQQTTDNIEATETPEAPTDTEATAQQDAIIAEGIKGLDDIKADEALPQQVEQAVDNQACPVPQAVTLSEVKPKKKHKGLKIAMSIAACFLVLLLVAAPILKNTLNGLLEGISDKAVTAINGIDSKDLTGGSASLKGEHGKFSLSEEFATDTFDGSAEIGESIMDSMGTDDGSGLSVLTPIEPEPDDPGKEIIETPSAGQLTAGEWNDNKNWDFFSKVIKSNAEFVEYQKSFSIYPKERLEVIVKSSGNPVVNATVTALSAGGDVLWVAVTDNEGTAYLFPSLFDDKAQNAISSINVVSGDKQKSVKVDGKSSIEVDLESAKKYSKALDLMFVIDTTGSMTDELYYLQWELKNIIETVKEQNSNIPVRLSVNFYRDEGDDYVVRDYEFSTDIDECVSNLIKEEAEGGGDYEEAVEQALENAINDHDWNKDAYAKLVFLVLDAPAHETDEITESLHSSIEKAASQGIRVISVAASGVDKRTEMMLRSFAVATGGTYTFLTDDSGIGGSHIEPTIGQFTVRQFNECIIDVINSYLK